MARYSRLQKRLENKIRRKLTAGVAAAMKLHHKHVQTNIEANQVNPIGTHTSNPPDRSKPGEYPWREFGDMAQDWRNVGVIVKDMTARVGVTQLGEHMTHLEFGVHPATLQPFARKGMVAAFHEVKPQMIAAFFAAAKAKR